MPRDLTRRELFAQTALVAGASLVTTPTTVAAAAASSGDSVSSELRYCLNTSTIRGQKIPLDQEIDLAAKAGYDGIEPWINEIQQFVKGGGKLADLRRRMDDHNLTMEGAIGFANWIVDDDEKRAEGLESLKRDMDLVRQLGGTRIAAPPTGATNQVGLDLSQAARRYAEAIRVGEQIGVYPQLELWGFSKTLSRLGELMFVAIESGHKEAAVLLDVYHIYKGGSDFAGLEMIDGSAVNILHMNDYPDIPREKIGDADRVFPGDGIAPVASILKTLLKNGFKGTLSLELFNREYWQRDALDVLTTGLNSMRSAVEKS